MFTETRKAHERISRKACNSCTAHISDINYAGSNTCNKTYAGIGSDRNSCNKTYAGISSDSSSVFKSNICFCTCYPSAKTG